MTLIVSTVAVGRAFSGRDDTQALKIAYLLGRIADHATYFGRAQMEHLRVIHVRSRSSGQKST